MMGADTPGFIRFALLKGDEAGGQSCQVDNSGKQSYE